MRESTEKEKILKENEKLDRILKEKDRLDKLFSKIEDKTKLTVTGNTGKQF